MNDETFMFDEALRLIEVKAEPLAATILYALLQERMPGQSISHHALPAWDEHLEFVNSHPYRKWWLCQTGERYVGALYLTQRNEIGIGILRQYQNQGYGNAFVRLATALYEPLPASPSECPGRWLANINPRNAPSIRMFERLGFTHIQNTYEKE